ncbi:putative spermidine/putrescine transport system permease protein [Bosea sp. 62]|uniref:ABC transporter permease n=1 Tax=unclassified Bosea (in: a-proteobacteria) TaxID=2653178 RepID=UPI00125B3FDA|nr:MULTISPECIES: ABC transporter permease [unclassified Bosea (in: a-proteobacteria)]CAD5256559.1 putative spermidine/putrescine transport system permease protein [Bosea sp. 7B]CAD5273895.1 putative spermidine/putrescine transport system permease protein [Bosea sp. 21B]CAD5284230.1 putative spermidine/putrescine transport system permease protein [Bosea sp. 46]VVT60157.1 putative spermidine/putrescine transport system permease protein [Bosea sp. EC-HK365B]VXB57414.1 putative spermidine/putresci
MAAPLLLAPAMVALLIFVVMPLLWVARTSFNQGVDGAYMVSALTMDNYARFLGSSWYLINTLWFSIRIAIVATAISVLLGYPVALYIAQTRGLQKSILMTMVLAPLLIGLVTLVYGWIVIFRGGGLLNSLMIAIGVYDEPVRYMWDLKGVIILLVYIGMPYIVLSLLDSIERINPSFVEAARNVGANRWRAFWSITFPLTLPGLYAGLVIVFTLNFSAFAVPLMVGANDTQMIGLVIYREALLNNDLPFASSLSVIMILANATMLTGMSFLFGKLILNRLEAKR